MPKLTTEDLDKILKLINDEIQWHEEEIADQKEEIQKESKGRLDTIKENEDKLDNWKRIKSNFIQFIKE